MSTSETHIFNHKTTVKKINVPNRIVSRDGKRIIDSFVQEKKKEKKKKKKKEKKKKKKET